jgi:hypothetical protein
MVAPATAHGLSTTDLEQIRDALTSGRKPRVVFTDSAGQVAGQVGQVVDLTDPEVSDEWIVVRFGRDELPFSPVDLAIPPRSASARRVEPKATPEFKIDHPRSVPAPREEPVMPASIVETPSASSTAKQNGADTTRPGENGAAKKPVRAGKPKVPASLTVTLAYTEREWTVAANQGAKALAKPYVIRPTEALRMVALLDVPGVHEAVEHIIAAERAEAEGRAQRLRTELAEIEARLSELTRRG